MMQHWVFGWVASALACALAGTLVASLLAWVPGLHVYSVAGLVLLLLPRLEARGVGALPPPDGPYPPGMAMVLLGMVVGYAVNSTIPSLFFAAPDESSAWIVLPGQRYMMRGRGHEAALLAGIGSLGGLAALVALAPFVTSVLSPIRQVLQPHLHWLLGLVALFVLLSEWPRGEGRGATALARLWDGWRSLIAGLLTFALSGLLGLILAYRPLIPVQASYQGLMPAFVGLFAVPWLALTVVSRARETRARIPRQPVCTSVGVTPASAALGIGTGVLGGLLAAFFPVVTGGIGGLIAGHATAQRDDRVFLVSQGACKVVYYAGALLFYFAPALHLTRGGMAWMLTPFYVPYTPQEYWLAVAAIALCGALAVLLYLWFARGAMALVGRLSARWLSGGTLVVLLVLVIGLTGWRGALVCAAATGIGLIPALSGARRLNCLGVLLVPALLNMSGLGPTVAGWLGLL
jgi:putative membrane protein